MSERFLAAIAVSCASCTSSSQNFDDGVCYALSKLGLPDLDLKKEKNEAIYAVSLRNRTLAAIATSNSELKDLLACCTVLRCRVPAYRE